MIFLDAQLQMQLQAQSEQMERQMAVLLNNQAKIDELSENGAYAVLQKPLSLSKLHETMKSFINSEDYGEQDIERE